MSAAKGTLSSSAMSSRQARIRQWLSAAVIVLMLAATAGALVYYLVQALQWVSRPTLVGLIGPSQVIDAAPLIYNTPWDGTEAGFDTIVKMDGMSLSVNPKIAEKQMHNYAAAWFVGHEVEFAVRRRVTSLDRLNNPPENFDCERIRRPESYPVDITCTFTTTVGYFPSGAFLSWFVVPYTVGVCLFGVGLAVLWLRRNQLSARVFALLCSAMALSLAGLFDNYSTHSPLITLWPLTIALVGGMLGIFTLTFPADLGLVRRHSWLRWLPLVPTALVGGYALWMITRSPSGQTYYWIWTSCLGFAGVSLALFILVAWWRRRHTASYTVREQGGMVLVGGFMAFSPLFLVSSSFVLEWLFNVSPLPLSIAGATPFVLAFPATLGFAILQRHRFETDQLISRGMVYTVLGAAIILSYALATIGISMILGSLLQSDSPVLIAFVVMVVAFGLLPVRYALERLVDRVYFRTRRIYQNHLMTFGHTLTKVVEPAEVVEAIRTALHKALLPTHIYFYMLDSDTNHYTARGSNRASVSGIRFDARGGVAQTLHAHDDLIHLEAETRIPVVLITDITRLRVLKVVVVAALKGRRHEQLIGFVGLGAKRSGEPYEYEDLRFIENLIEQASLAVERAQVIADLERHVDEMDALSKVAQAVNFTVEFDDLLELVYAQASRVIDTSNFFITLYDEKSNELSYAFFIQNNERISEREGERWRLGRGLLSEVVHMGQPIRTDDYLTECAKRDIRPRERGLHAWMGIPMNTGASTLGAVAVASTLPGFMYTDDQLKVFWAIADAAATAIDKSRLFTETGKRARQLASLNRISTQLAQELDVERLLEQILYAAVDILRSETGSLLLCDEETGDLEFKVATGEEGQKLVGTRLPRGTGIVGTVAERGETIIVNDVHHDPRWFSGIDQDIEFLTESLLAVPLIAHGATTGVLQVINKRDGSIFVEDDEQLLATFAAQAAIALQNARLFQQTDEELTQRVEELQLLSRIDRDLNAGLEIDRIVELTLQWALRVSGADAGLIGSIDPERGLEIILHYGYEDVIADLLDKPISLDRGISGRVYRTGKPDLVTRVGIDPDYMPFSPDTKAEMVVPLRAGGEVAGVIVLDSFASSMLTEEDMEAVVRVAEHASPAITNARLFERIKAANEAKSVFVGAVSHELKTPMTSVQGYAQMLMQGGVGDVSQAQMRFLGTINSNVERMRNLVDELEDITAIETGKIRLFMAAIQLQDVVEETLQSTRAMIDDKEQVLELLIPADLPDIMADKGRMLQIVTNLVTNSIKYTPEDGEVTIRAEVVKNVWDPGGPSPIMHVYIRDNGIGISPEDQVQLFQQFFRSTNPDARDLPGTGLGLNIAKNLIELHGGTIWVESTLNEGSTFHFTVPLAD